MALSQSFKWDFKKLGRIGRVGHRISGDRTARVPSLARTHALTHYLGYYNTARSHMGIHGLTPRQKLAAL
jgi:hypothetical protein